MAESKTILLPDVGDFEDIEIIEILVAAGDQVDKEQSIIVLESDKATMEIPSPYAGTIESMKVKVGDRVNEGDEIAAIQAGDGGGESKPAEEKAPAEPAAAEKPADEPAPSAE
ncbi:MAG: hypothetical protein PVJ78_04260, partial [Gammaproteobacteria bacterium]